MTADGLDFAQGGLRPAVLHADRTDVFLVEVSQAWPLVGERSATTPGELEEEGPELVLRRDALFHELKAPKDLFGHGGILVNGAVHGPVGASPSVVFVPVGGEHGGAGLDVYRPHAVDMHPHTQADPPVRGRFGAQ